jgi:hypothetical protein
MSAPSRKNKKKKNNKRDPNRPKRAMTPFLFFACEQRKLLKAKGKKMTLPEQSRYIAEVWKSVTDKSTYVELSDKDRARYYREMESYKPPYRIKRPRSSYAFFMRDMRASVAARFPEKTPRELMSHVAACWKASSEEITQKYVQMAKDDKVRYENEKKENIVIA